MPQLLAYHHSGWRWAEGHCQQRLVCSGRTCSSACGSRLAFCTGHWRLEERRSEHANENCADPRSGRASGAANCRRRYSRSDDSRDFPKARTSFRKRKLGPRRPWFGALWPTPLCETDDQKAACYRRDIDNQYTHPIFRSANAETSPAVELSCPVAATLPCTTGNSPVASSLPSSTPHWSKELMRKTTPSTKTRCS